MNYIFVILDGSVYILGLQFLDGKISRSELDYLCVPTQFCDYLFAFLPYNIRKWLEKKWQEV